MYPLDKYPYLSILSLPINSFININKITMKKQIYILVLVIITILIAGLYFSNQDNKKEVSVNTANDIMINSSDVGVGWSSKGGGYINDPASDFAKLYEQFNLSEDDPKSKLPEELSSNDVKDAYILYLIEFENNITISLSVVTVFVFNDTKGAKNFFDYNKNNRFNSIFNISDIGDEAIISEDKGVLVVRYSNVDIEVDTNSIEDKEAVSVNIAKKIINKIKKNKNNMRKR